MDIVGDILSNKIFTFCIKKNLDTLMAKCMTHFKGKTDDRWLPIGLNQKAVSETSPRPMIANGPHGFPGDFPVSYSLMMFNASSECSCLVKTSVGSEFVCHNVSPYVGHPNLIHTL